MTGVSTFVLASAVFTLAVVVLLRTSPRRWSIDVDSGIVMRPPPGWQITAVSRQIEDSDHMTVYVGATGATGATGPAGGFDRVQVTLVRIDPRRKDGLR